MATFTITEKQNLNSVRDGEIVEAKDLAAAKRKASKMQCFQGTVLTIEQNGSLIAHKSNGSWFTA